MRRFPLCVLLTAIVAVASQVAAGSVASPRIVVIGDVHGAVEEFAAILEKAGVVDGNRRWSGGRTVLVQTGDVTDRGAGMKGALDLLMSLEQQAAASGGRVQPVLGNHEIMNLTGEMRDATPEIFATFGGEAAMREAFSPKGRYGRWLRTKPVVVEIDDTIFMHAGINPASAPSSLDHLNAVVHRELRQWDDGVRWLELRGRVPRAPALRTVIDAARREVERVNVAAAQGQLPDDAAEVANLMLPLANIGNTSLFNGEGPLWFRGYSTWTDAEGAPQMEGLLRKYGAKRFVTGHTVQPEGRITERFDGKLFLIDTGMLGRPYFPGGRPSALVLQGQTARPLYLP